MNVLMKNGIILSRTSCDVLANKISNEGYLLNQIELYIEIKIESSI